MRWKSVVGYEGWYEVSDRGHIRRTRPGKGVVLGRILRPGVDPNGYQYVGLFKHGRRHPVGVHIIVAAAFKGRRPKKHVVNHKDGDKLNCRPSNLEYATHKNNCLHGTRVLGKNSGERHGMSKLTRKKVMRIKRLRNAGLTYDAIARRVGCTDANVGCICRGETWVNR